MKRANTEDWPYCGLRDDAEHTAFVCPRWAEQRCGIAQCIGVDVGADNLVTQMLEREVKWSVIATNLAEMVKLKEEEEKVFFN